jgi:integrase
MNLILISRAAVELRADVQTLLMAAEARARQASEPKPAESRHVWCRAVQRAEVDDFRFRDLRHAAASYLAMNGATLSEIAAVLGHKTLSMVKRYAHLSEVHTTGVVERMNQRFLGEV